MQLDIYRQKIAFADYKTEEDAVCARDYLQGYVFPNSEKGMCIRISENSKRKGNTPGGYNPTPIREEKRGGYQNMHDMGKPSHRNSGPDDQQDYHPRRRERDMGYQDNMRQKEPREEYYRSQQDMHPQAHRDPRVKQDTSGYGYMQDRGRTQDYADDEPRMMRPSDSMQDRNSMPQQSFLHNPLVNSRQPAKMKSMPMSHPQDQQSLDHLNSNLDIHQNVSHPQDGYILNDIITMPNSSEGNSGISHLDQYVIPQNASSSLDNSGMGSNPNYMSGGGNVQSLPMSNVVVPSNPTQGGRVSVQYAPMPANNPSSMSGWRGSSNSEVYNQSPPNYSDALADICSQFYDVLPIPKTATNTVYVEGIPFSTSEREVARKSALANSLDMFRPFPGFKSVRLIPRDKKNGEKVIFCFADFDNSLQTTMVINTLQVGYVL